MIRNIITGKNVIVNRDTLSKLLCDCCIVSEVDVAKYTEAIFNGVPVIVQCIDSQMELRLMAYGKDYGFDTENISKPVQAREMDTETLDRHKNGYNTVGYLKEFIDTATVLTQRVYDMYYISYNWETVKKKGDCYYHLEKWNRDIDEGKYLDKQQYPMMKEERLVKVSEEDLQECMAEFSPIHCFVKYKDDENLYLHLHY